MFGTLSIRLVRLVRHVGTGGVFGAPLLLCGWDLGGEGKGKVYADWVSATLHSRWVCNYVAAV